LAWYLAHTPDLRSETGPCASMNWQSHTVAMDNDAEEKYISWPDRLYIVGSDGKIAYKGGLGPFYFDVDEFESEMAKLTAT